MDANKIIEKMNNRLTESINDKSFNINKLDDITYECLEELKTEMKKNVNETLEKSQEELKKKNVQNVQN